MNESRSKEESPRNVIRNAVAKKWGHQTSQKGPERINWWESKDIRGHVNRLVCGEPGLTVPSQGAVKLMQSRWPGRVFRRGVSVGAGIGSKEMRLMRNGLVERFDVFELSEVRIERGRQDAKTLGLSERITFRNDNAFDIGLSDTFDFVHWNNSLHHMFDVVDAVRWSYDVLVSGGVFFMDDYVGPSRMQWSDRAIEIASRVRMLLPDRLLLNPHKPGQNEILRRHAQRPSAKRIEREDPSEAADSDRILYAVRKFFPDALIIPTGGVIYHLALPNVLHNFDESNAEDRALLQSLLLIDELCLQIPGIETHYAVALGTKDNSSLKPLLTPGTELD